MKISFCKIWKLTNGFGNIGFDHHGKYHFVKWFDNQILDLGKNNIWKEDNLYSCINTCHC